MADTDIILALRIALKDEISKGLDSIGAKLGDIGVAWLSWKGAELLMTSILTETAKFQGQMIDLGEAVKRTGAEWAKAAPEIESFTKRMEEQKGVVDDYARGALQRAIDFTKDLGKAEQLVSMAADIAVVKHVDLEQAVTLLGKAYQGNIMQLTRMLPELKDVIKEGDSLETILKALAYYQGAADAETGKLSTKFALMWDALSDVNEALGKAVGGGEKGGGLIGIFVQAITMVANGTTHLIDGLKGVKDALLWVFHFGYIFGKATEEVDDFATSLRNSAQAAGYTGEAVTSSHAEIRKSLDAVRNDFVSLDAVLQANHTTWNDMPPVIDKSAISMENMAKSLREYLQLSKNLIREGQADPAALWGMPEGMAEELAGQLDELDAAQARSIAKREQQTKTSNQGEVKAWRDKNRMLSQDTLATFGVAIPGALQSGVNKMLGQWKWLNEESNGIFKAMAQDFVRLFIEEILSQLALKLATGILKILAIFDVAKNDRFAQQQGRDFAKHFSTGVISGMSGLGPSLAGSVSMPNITAGYPQQYSQPTAFGNQVTIHIHGAMTKDFIRDSLAPLLEKDSLKGINEIQTKATFTTGRSPLALA